VLSENEENEGELKGWSAFRVEMENVEALQAVRKSFGQVVDIAKDKSKPWRANVLKYHMMMKIREKAEKREKE